MKPTQCRKRYELGHAGMLFKSGDLRNRGRSGPSVKFEVLF